MIEGTTFDSISSCGAIINNKFNYHANMLVSENFRFIGILDPMMILNASDLSLRSVEWFLSTFENPNSSVDCTSTYDEIGMMTPCQELVITGSTFSNFGNYREVQSRILAVYKGTSMQY